MLNSKVIDLATCIAVEYIATGIGFTMMIHGVVLL
jgi:hypothetical protein